MRSYAPKLRLLAGKPLLVLLVVAPVLLAGIMGPLLSDKQALAATSSTVNFQARLMNAAGAIAPDGDYNVEFKIYDTASTGATAQGVCTGNCKWVETRISGDKIQVANGYISVSLGSVTAFSSTMNWDQELWITMNIGGTGSPSWDGEMTPRLKLTAVPYAFSAGKLNAMSGANKAVLQFAATINQDSTITLPDPGVSGAATVCYQNSASCGFLTGAATDYIQNGTAIQTPANFAVRSAAVGSVGGVIQGANGQTADIFQVQTWNGTSATTQVSVNNSGVLSALAGLTASGGAISLNDSSNNNTTINTGSSTGTVTIGNGSAGAISVTSGSTFALTATNLQVSTAGVVQLAGSQTIDVTTAAAATATNITLQPGNSTGNTTTGAGTTIRGGDVSGTTTVTGGAVVIRGGDATGGSGTRNGGSVSIDGGTGASSNGSVNIGTAANSHSTNVGSTNGASTTTVQAGTGGLNVGTGGVANTIQVGNTTGGVAQTINIGTNATASSTNTINVGTTSTSQSIITLNGGTGSNNLITLQTNNASAGVLVKSLTNSTSAFSVQNASGTNGILFNIDTTNGWMINNGVTHPHNLVENPSFEASGAFMLSGWNYNGQSAITNNSANAHHGNNAMVSTANSTNFNISSLKYLEAVPGDVFYADLWYKAAAGTDGAGSFSFQYYDASKANIGSSSAAPMLSASTTYTRASLTATAPANTAYVRLSIGINNTSTTGTWYTDEVTIVRVNEVTPKLFKNAVDSTTAFQIQDASSNLYMNVDTQTNAIALGFASSTTTLNGTVKVATLGASTSNSAAVCRDTSTNNLTACDSSNTTGKAFLQGGNSFGAAAVLGTNDANDLNIRTNGNNTRLTVGASGGITVAAGNTLTVTSALTSLTGATSGDALSVSNSTSTGNIALFKDNATTVMTIADGGAVTLQNAGDSASALRVMNALGTATAFNVDTQNTRVGIGTNAPDRALHVSVNNTTTTAPTVLIAQAGTGDASVEFSTPTAQFYAGVDASDNSFNVSSYTANAGTVDAGYQADDPNTANPDHGNPGLVVATKVASTSAGSLSSVSVYIGSVTVGAHVKVGIYADNGSGTAPGNLIANSAEITPSPNSWNAIPVSASIAAGTTYWLAYRSDDNNVGATRYSTTGTMAYVSASYAGAWPSPFGTPTTNTNLHYLMYMTYTSSGGSVDSFGNSLLKIGDTGQSTFRNSVDSSAAFRIQNAVGTTLFGANTSSATLNVGIVGTTATASTVNVATSTGATQTINIGSAATNTAANGTTVLIQGGNTASAVQIQALASGTIAIGSNNAANTVQIGSTTLSSGTQTINIGNNNTSGGTTNVTIGNGASATAGATTLQAKTSVTVNTNGVTRATFDNTNTLYLGNGVTAAAPNNFTLQATGSSTAATAGANLTIQGGTGNTSGAGGKVTIQGGTAGGSGVKGLIELNGGTYFTTGTYSSGSTSTITQALVDSNSAILASATAGSLTFTVPTPTNGASQAGRVLYITNNGANAFILSFASSNLSLSPGATATLIYSGSAWTGAGVDSATLQNDYSNGVGGTTPEIIVDSTRNGIDIQDNSLTSGTRLLAVRGTATASTLGSALFVVDNTGKVGIGIEQPTRQLQVTVNNTTTTAPPIMIEQLGSGDASLEFKATGGSFFAGIDSSDSGGKFKINSSAAAGSSSTFGRLTIGASTDSSDINNQNASRFTMGGTAGTLNSITVYINSGSGSNQYSVAIYADNTGVPGALIASSPNTTIVPNAWNTAPVSTSLGASTAYWLAFNTNDAAANMRFDNTGTSCFVGRTFNLGWTSPNFGTCSGGVGTQNFSIYGNYTIAGTVDSFGANSLFAMSNIGQATFQNFTNSTTAFQVLNAAGTTLLGVDSTTAAPIVNLGVTGAVAQASTVNVGTSTGATQTINIGSGTTNTAANGTTVLIQGGNTASAVSVQALASGTINIGTNNAANTLQFGSTTLSSGTQTINIGNNNTGGGTTNITIGNGASATGGSTTIQAKATVAINTNGVNRLTFDNTNTAYFGNGVTNATPNSFTLQATGSGTAGTAGAGLTVAGGTGNGSGGGGTVTIQGGSAAATAGSTGGGVTIAGANGTSTGTGAAAGNIILRGGSAGGSGNNAGGSVSAILGAATGTGSVGTFTIQNALGASLLTVDPSNTGASLNLVANSGAETGSPPTSWAAQGTGSSVAATTTAAEVAAGSQAARVTFGTSANAGGRVGFTTAPTASSTAVYVVSFSAKLISGTAMSNTLQVLYSPDNGTTLSATCSNYNTQGLSTTAWTKVTCTFIPGTTSVTTALLIFRQTDAPGVSRIIAIDNVSVVNQNSTGTSNVGGLKVGGAVSQGLTLFTLDTYAANPFTGANTSLAGSMYFDTTSNKIQCYDGASWGACGAAPNGIVTLTPEYAGAVLNGTGIGTMTSDFCANSGALTVGTLCNTNDARNFYKWTSPQGTAQTYNVYVTYKLPPTFKQFVSGTTTMTGLVDNTTNAALRYAVFKSTGSAITSCSALSTVVGAGTGSANTWTTGTAGVLGGTTDPATCGFAAGNNVIFQIQVSANSNANAYAENLNFQYTNQ
jgi:hypothetical protein